LPEGSAVPLLRDNFTYAGPWRPGGKPMRTDLIFCGFNLRVWRLAAILLAGSMGLMGQTPQNTQQPGAPQQSGQQPGGQQPQPPPGSDAAVIAQQAQTTAAPAKTEPDYPDPRTLITVGLFYWLTKNGSGPDLRGGATSTDFATLDSIGEPRASEAAEIVVPITRTGAIHLEYFRTTGTGNQTLKTNSDLFLNPFYSGDYLATNYKIQSGKLYLDDLLWPYKFPVSRFRLKSLWEVQYLTVVTSVNAPLAPTSDAQGNAISTTGQGTRTFILPSFGLAAEYAITPHILFRADGSGFGLHHKSAVWDASATVAWRHNFFEVVGGFKAFYFKTSPNNTEYLTDTLSGAFVGLRFHFF
jgi:hypothetical protein